MKAGFLLMMILPVLWISTGAASDRTMRCSGRLVGIGADKSEVVEKCGDPDKVARWEEGSPGSYFSQPFDYEHDRYQAPKSIKGPLLYERWTYDFGSNKLVRYLIFENGKLIKIETGERGTK